MAPDGASPMEGTATQLVIHTPEPNVKRRMQTTQPVSPGFNGSGNMYRSLFHQVGNRWGAPTAGMQPGEAAARIREDARGSGQGVPQDE